MIKVSKKELEPYEEMEKLCLTDEEWEFAIGAASVVKDSFQLLSSIDTEGVSPLVGVFDNGGTLREDIARKDISRGELLSNAPDEQDGFFRIPRALE